MKLDKSSLLFFGCRIDSRLREALAMAKEGDRKYFEDPEAGFLRIIAVPREEKDRREERWIGKAVKGGMNCAEVEDVQRNVVSILRRIAPETRVNPATIKIFVVDESEPSVPISLDPDPDEDDNGPYIEY